MAIVHQGHKERYHNDNLVEVKPNHFIFSILGSLVKVISSCISVKVSGSHAKRVEKYVSEVALGARVSVGSWVQRWNEYGESRAFSPPELQISHARCLQIESLDDRIGDSSRVINRPDDCLVDCHSYFKSLEVEHHGGAGASIAGLCYNAFQISNTHGDPARASVLAGRFHKSKVFAMGRIARRHRK